MENECDNKSFFSLQSTVAVRVDHLLSLIHWARRYADGRMTWVPRDFNEIYFIITNQYPYLKNLEFQDKLLTHDGRHFPYAQDGSSLEKNDKFDAVTEFMEK